MGDSKMKIRPINFFRSFWIVVIGLINYANSNENCDVYAGTNKEFYCRADQGDREAQYSLGVGALDMGQMDVALKWLKKAAEPDASNQSVYMPPVGSGKGKVLLVPSSNPNPGYKPAQIMLYRFYILGLGVDRDEEKANRYKELAAKAR